LRNARPALEVLEDRLVPATFTVNTTADVLDATDGKLSLREAITQANNHPGADTIVVPAGTYKVATGPGPGPVNDSGAFDVLDSATIKGAGAGSTIIDAQALDRVFAVTGTPLSPIKATFRGLTVRGGSFDGDGGGILVSNADLTLRDSRVAGNSAALTGAGISNIPDPGAGKLKLINSTVSRNVAGSDGGGIAWIGEVRLRNSRVQRNGALYGGGLSATTVTLIDSAVNGNSAVLGGGGLSATTATLTRSTVNGNSASFGGGILAPTTILTGSTVKGNIAFFAGGGIRATSMATLTSSTVSGNFAGLDGGGINASTATLINSTVSGNTSDREGGGIWVFGASLTGSTVSDNHATRDGGGIRATIVAELIRSTVRGNTAGNSGGGIYAATATLTSSTVRDNTVDSVGGGILADTATLISSTVSGNHASDIGGGINATTAILTNSTVSGNLSAKQGGGIVAQAMTLVNATIVDNFANLGGGGVLHFGTTGPATVRNTIIALNLVGYGGSGPDAAGVFASQGHNLIGDGTGSNFANDINSDQVGTAQNPLDPKLGPLARNGGPTRTHALLSGSPALDKGDNSGAPDTDQRNVRRPRDSNGDGLAVVDIGAFER